MIVSKEYKVIVNGTVYEVYKTKRSAINKAEKIRRRLSYNYGIEVAEFTLHDCGKTTHRCVCEL